MRYAPPPGAVAELDVVVTANKRGTDDGATARLAGAFKHNGGTVLRIGVTDAVIRRTAGMALSESGGVRVEPDGDHVAVLVSPGEAETIDWSVVLRAHEGVIRSV
jgi:hypothetical protein